MEFNEIIRLITIIILWIIAIIFYVKYFKVTDLNTIRIRIFISCPMGFFAGSVLAKTIIYLSILFNF